jgi:hypothetical protein
MSASVTEVCVDGGWEVLEEMLLAVATAATWTLGRTMQPALPKTTWGLRAEKRNYFWIDRHHVSWCEAGVRVLMLLVC